MLKSENILIDQDALLLEFNKRHEEAFSEVYKVLFDVLYHFAQRLFYATGIDAEDLVQDIFVTIWSNPKMVFSSIDHIKNYVYISIKNKHKDFLKHKLRHDKYEDMILYVDDYHFSQMVENETISLLHIADSILPSECAKVLRLYLEGYDVKEIASELGKSHNTVYHQRTKAIAALKKYLLKNNIGYFFTFFKIV